MSVDQYAICPCGNGKKIKFCKCKDSVQMMDEVMQMAGGGQVVPALDRLKSILESNPEAAWALALRGRLLMAVNETQQLKENAERFLRLQPSNPLALAQSAIAKLEEGDTEKAMEALTEAVSESGLTVDSQVLELVVIMASVMAETENFLTARSLAMMGLMSEGFEGSDQAINVLRSLNQSPSINHLLKSLPRTIERPQDVNWAERYDEARTLLQNNKIVQARGKFESLQRVASGEPAVLSGLLQCAIWSGDRERQCDLLRSLSECEPLDESERTRFLAMAESLAVDQGGLTVAGIELTATFDNADAVQMALTASGRFETLNVDTQQLLDPERGVPPKTVAVLLDKEMDRSKPAELTADDWPVAVTAVYVFGKQTDRDAEIRVAEFPASMLEDVKTLVTGLDPSVKILREEPASLPLPAVVAKEPVRPNTEEEAEALSRIAEELIVNRMPSRITDAPLKILGERSLRDAAADASIIQAREAACLAISMDAQLNLTIEMTDKVRELAGLPAVEPVTALTEEEVDSLPVESLARLKLDTLSKDQLEFLLRRSREMRMSAASERFADQVLTMDLGPEDAPMKFDALVTKYSSSGGRDVGSLDQAVAMVDAGTVDQPPIYIYKLRQLLQDRNVEGFQTLLQDLGTRYRDRADVQQMLQMFLVEIGLLRPDGSPRNAPPPPADAGGGLWTPDQGMGGAAVPPPAGGSSTGSSGGSKIILPGME